MYRYDFTSPKFVYTKTSILVFIYDGQWKPILGKPVDNMGSLNTNVQNMFLETF